MERMTTSDNGIELLKRFEGLELEAYRDIAGVWTIGYGHTGVELDLAMGIIEAGGTPGAGLVYFPFEIVDGGLFISAETAEALLRSDLASRERLLNGWAISRGVALNKNEFDALISFIYNVGFAAFRGSTAAKRLEKGDRPDREGGQSKTRAQWRAAAADALTWWNKATVNGKLREVAGLTRRRNAEKNLFLTPPNWSAPPRRLGIVTDSPLHPIDHKESNCAPAKECRPLAAWLPRF